MKRSMKLLAAALAGTIALSGCAKSSDKQASSAETTIAETESSKEASAASTETSEESADPVSYTHLDVYKRQVKRNITRHDITFQSSLCNFFRKRTGHYELILHFTECQLP